MSKSNYVDNYIYGPHLNIGKNGTVSNPAVNEEVAHQRMYMRAITELAMARFKWEGLPEEIDPRFLELTLCRQALSVFFPATHPAFGTRYFALQGTGAGRIDPYDNPTTYIVNGNNFLNMTIKRKHCVPIYANYLRQPDWDVIWLFSQKLAHISRSITIAEKNMRNTNVIYATENTQLSAQNIERMRDQGQMTVYLKKGGALSADDFTAIDMKVHPDTLPKLMVAKSKYWNECMTLLGINNANQDKAERVQAAEVAANDDQIETNRRVALNARQQAVEEINRKYGLNVSVDFHSEQLEEPTLDMAGGFGNGDNNNAITSGAGTDT